MRIVFLGSPEFAAVPLRQMVAAGYDVVAVFSQPDRPRGKRGKELKPTPVKEAAMQLAIPVYTPAKLNAPEAVAQLKALQPDLLVVVAYGQLLSKEVLQAAPLGAINIHGSLLPFYRGAAPIQRVLMNGERESGITIMYLDQGMDTGDMILRQVLPVEENETFGSLHDKLCQLGSELLLSALPLIEAGTATRVAQAHEQATYAPKLSREEELINWQAPAAQVHNLIRALDPAPGAYTIFRNKRLKLFGSSLGNGQGEPGEILQLTAEAMEIACQSGSVWVAAAQPEGKTKMPAADFARGYQIQIGGRL